VKGPLTVDLALHDFGAAEPAILRIVSLWQDIDWFEPPTQPSAIGHAHLLGHQHLGHRHAPEHFAARIDVEHRHGGWPEFVALCHRVRQPGAFDWKLGPLKSLLGAHDRRCQFSLSAAAPRYLREGVEFEYRHLLIMPCNGSFVWGCLRPTLDLERLGDAVAESARFYLSYAQGDALDAIQWQLAEPGSPIDSNPFLPLLHGYASGYYPFALSETQFVLFHFTPPSTPVCETP
jgi:hypothetical protein